MSANLLIMQSHFNNKMKLQKKEKEDIGTCFNCIYQGTDSPKCNLCKRSFMWSYYKAPKNLIDNFKINT